MAKALCPIMLGRDEELGALDRALDEALAGSGALAVLTGEAGIGKSRLARELAARARGIGAAAVVGRAVPSGTATPYLPLTEALLQALRDREVPDDAGFAPWRPVLGALVPTLIGERAADASATARAEAVVQLLRRVAAPAGLVLVLEDLHWADPDTLSVVDYLGNNLAGARVLCLATSRDEPARAEIARLLNSRTALHLPLRRLDEQVAAQMVRACVPSADRATVGRVLRVADGVPFLVEEVLASPGVPASFAETVRVRLDGFDDDTRAILSTAAVLGRMFDWRLLAPASGLPQEVVDQALERGVQEQLLRVDGDAFSFRHALSREAILERLLPPRRRALAAAALSALDADLVPAGPTRDLAADLAAQAGDAGRAGALLTEAGRQALDAGALATATDTLRRAHTLGDPGAVAPLVQALALAGRVDEAFAVGEHATGTVKERVAIHLELAHAAVAATRWALAGSQLAETTRLLAGEPDPAAQARVAVLRAEVALAADDVEPARQLAADVVAGTDAAAETRCQAWEILGRVERFSDRPAARRCFEQALDTARAADLPFWQLRAMHELGTIDMFDHAGVRRLLEARRAAEEVGALSTVAVLDLQLGASHHCRFELASANRHAQSALALSEQLGAEQVRPRALVMLTENAAWRGDRDEMERFAGRTTEASHDPVIAAFVWGSRGMFELLHGDRDRAVDGLGRAAEILADLPHAEPAAFRAVWPVLLASTGDPRAQPAIATARRLGVDSFRLNAGLLRGAVAILAGRGGDVAAARRWANESAPHFANCTTWSDITRWLAAESAAAHGWDRPDWWLAGVADRLAARGLAQLAARCRSLAGGTERWAGLGVTAREADVLSLVVEGLPNKEIAHRLHLSPRTVEKHVESLLRKLDARSRAQLVSLVGTRTT